MGDFEDRWAEFEQEVGPRLAEAMAVEAPYVTGQLSESHTWRDNGGSLEVVSEDARGPIAAYVVRGTAPHGIDPVNGEFLRFPSTEGDEFIYARHVDHPGTAPNPYNQRAWESVRDDVVQEFKERVGRRYAVSLLNPWRNAKI